jgi:hypothetical protein
MHRGEVVLTPRYTSVPEVAYRQCKMVTIETSVGHVDCTLDCRYWVRLSPAVTHVWTEAPGAGMDMFPSPAIGAYTYKHGLQLAGLVLSVLLSSFLQDSTHHTYSSHKLQCNPLNTKLKGLIKCLFYLNFLLSEQLGILGAFKVPFATLTNILHYNTNQNLTLSEFVLTGSTVLILIQIILSILCIMIII